MDNRVCQAPLVIYCAITFIFSSVAETSAQFDSLGLNTTWRRGSIVLDNNYSLKGLIQFNDKLGMIKLKRSPESEEESFVETSILSMQLYNEDTSTWRNFAVFNFNENETGRQSVMLFEVLMEFRKFALLTRVERVNIGVRQRQDAFGNYRNVKVGYEQFERLCLVNDSGTATVVLAVNEFESDKFAMANKLRPYLDKRALKKYLGDDWYKFETLVKSNKLNLKKRDDFIRAFEYYRQATLGDS
jgi:hypothetical protein